jgi:hypothetical protein
MLRGLLSLVAEATVRLQRPLVEIWVHSRSISSLLILPSFFHAAKLGPSLLVRVSKLKL